MNLELPPERPLPEPDRMLERILGENEEVRTTRPGSRRRIALTGLAVAAAVMVVAAVLGLPRLLAPPGPRVAASPMPTASPGSARLALGTSARFEHFTVTTRELRRDEAQGLLGSVEVCVQSLPPHPTGETTRISWDPWTVSTGERTFRPRLADASHPPRGLFPAESYGRVGDCVRGWVPFADVGPDAEVTGLAYRNSLGDAAVWMGAR